MFPEIKPEYQGNSIINLASSLLKRYNVFSQYPPLEDLPHEIICDSTNLVFFVIDGLGSNFLEQYGQNTIFDKYNRGKITSVFPTTTAAAMLSYYTGISPKNHGIPAWFTYLRQIGMVSTILPFTPRNKDILLTEFNVEPRQIYSFESLFDKLEVSQYILMPEDLNDTPLTRIINEKRNEIGYEDLDDLFLKLNKLIEDHEGESNFIFVYWPVLDEMAHKFGVSDEKTISHFQELTRYFENYVASWKAKDPFFRLILSADHGLIDIPEENQLNLEDFPALSQSLTLPLSGEARAPFFYVHPDQIEIFKEEIEKNFASLGTLYTRKEILESNLFGLFELHPQLPSRIGDYVFIFEKPYTLKDTILGEKRHKMVGHHGGLSEEELYVPFIVF